MGTFSCSRGRVRGGERMSAWRKGSGGEPGVDVARHENVSHMGRIFVSGWRIRVENRRTPPTAQMGRLVVCLEEGVGPEQAEHENASHMGCVS